MPQVEVVGLPNSCVVVEIDLDEIPFFRCQLRNASFTYNKGESISCDFDLNRVLIATCFNKCSRIVIFHHGLKEFLEKCLMQFQVYIWSIAHRHNIYNYLDQI
jgi:hypothetical protein